MSLYPIIFLGSIPGFMAALAYIQSAQMRLVEVGAFVAGQLAAFYLCKRFGY